MLIGNDRRQDRVPDGAGRVSAGNFLGIEDHRAAGGEHLAGVAPHLVSMMGPRAVPRERGVLVAQGNCLGAQHGAQMLGCLGRALCGEAVVKVLGGQRRRVERVIGFAVDRGTELTSTTAGSPEDPGQGH